VTFMVFYNTGGRRHHTETSSFSEIWKRLRVAQTGWWTLCSKILWVTEVYSGSKKTTD